MAAHCHIRRMLVHVALIQYIGLGDRHALAFMDVDCIAMIEVFIILRINGDTLRDLPLELTQKNHFIQKEPPTGKPTYWEMKPMGFQKRSTRFAMQG